MKPISLSTMLLLFVTFLHSTAIAEPNQKPQINNQNKAQGDYIRKRFLRLMNKPFDNNQQTQRKILIIGDSHAQDFLNAIAENNLFKNDLIRTRYIPTRCQIYLGNPSNR